MKKIPPRPPFSKGGIKGKNFNVLPPLLVKGDRGGFFLYCHSRESGNPMMSITNFNTNYNGIQNFSFV